ncbi:MAG: tetratricopeptide repeat protein [Hyphomonadaceae bacterium]|jgi:tetratricopeptide (TPR) repeat protein|nr:tetratricopeptide repeat protein [Hyphomonadaceae bacterium]
MHVESRKPGAKALIRATVALLAVVAGPLATAQPNSAREDAPDRLSEAVAGAALAMERTLQFDRFDLREPRSQAFWEVRAGQLEDHAKSCIERNRGQETRCLAALIDLRNAYREAGRHVPAANALGQIQQIATLSLGVGHPVSLVAGFEQCLPMPTQAISPATRACLQSALDRGQADLADQPWLIESMTLTALSVLNEADQTIGEAGDNPMDVASALVARAAVRLGEQDARVLDLNTDLAAMLLAGGRVEQGLTLARANARIARRIYRSDSPDLQAILLAAGVAESMVGNHGTAIRQVQAALAQLERLEGPDSTKLVSPLNSLTYVLFGKGDYAAAEASARRAVAIGELTLPGSRVLAASLNNLAASLQLQERAVEALPYMERALAITQSIFGPSGLQTLTMRNNLAQNLIDTGKRREGISMLVDTLARMDSSYAVDHPLRLATRSNLCLAREPVSTPVENLKCYEDLLNDGAEAVGVDDRFFADATDGVRTALRQLGRRDEARRYRRPLTRPLK